MGAESNLSLAVGKIIDCRGEISDRRAVLIAISGIDASGKGYVTARLADSLRRRGFHARTSTSTAG